MTAVSFPQAGPLTGLDVGADGAGLPHPAPRQPRITCTGIETVAHLIFTSHDVTIDGVGTYQAIKVHCLCGYTEHALDVDTAHTICREHYRCGLLP